MINWQEAYKRMAGRVLDAEAEAERLREALPDRREQEALRGLLHKLDYTGPAWWATAAASWLARIAALASPPPAPALGIRTSLDEEFRAVPYNPLATAEEVPAIVTPLTRCATCGHMSQYHDDEPEYGEPCLIANCKCYHFVPPATAEPTEAR